MYTEKRASVSKSQSQRRIQSYHIRSDAGTVGTSLDLELVDFYALNQMFRTINLGFQTNQAKKKRGKEYQKLTLRVILGFIGLLAPQRISEKRVKRRKNPTMKAKT